MTHAVHGRPVTSEPAGSPAPAADSSDATKGAQKTGDFFARVLDAIGLHGAAGEARRGSDLIHKAWDEQPTIERRIAVGLGRLWEANIRTQVAAGVDVAGPAIERVYGPTIRAAGEAAGEIAGAAGGVVRTDIDSLRELGTEVADAWQDQPTIERKIAVAGYEVAENLVQGRVRHLIQLGNVGREIVEGAADVAIHNPVANGARVVAEAGANGAVEAGKTLADTAKGNVQRTIDQQRENISEIGDSVAGVGRTLQQDAEQTRQDVQRAWDEQPTIERKLAVSGWQLLTGGVRSSIHNQVAQANVVKELGEAAVEHAVTGARNAVDVATAPIRAAGSFLGGLFGG